MLTTVLQKLFALLLAITTILPPTFSGIAPGEYQPKDPEKCLLSFAGISDTHVTDSAAREAMLAAGLEDMSNAAVPLDAMLISGDITDYGYEEQWQRVEKAFREHCNVKNVILASGNHDDRSREDDFNVARQHFFTYSQKISGRTLTQMYFSTKINGYTFLVLGSEEDHTYGTFSDAQLAWLQSEITAAAADGLPIFVVCHQPLNGSHGLPGTWTSDKDADPDIGGMGDQSAQIEAILKSVPNVFLISGHLHNGLGDTGAEKLYGYRSIESVGSFHSVNLPTYVYMTNKGRVLNGTGFQFEVYEDSVVIRGRNFAEGTWYTTYDYTIDLV